MEIHVSGGEYNVAANLSDCFGLRTGIATAMVKYPIGELIQGRVRETGVSPHYKWFEHDGVRGPNMATVYSDRARECVLRWSSTTGRTRPVALLKPGDFDWAGLFGRGVRWFHSGGIFASLSQTTAPLIIEGMQAAKAAGAITSFDLNYRAKLWASVGGAERGQQVIKTIAGNLDALIGNEEDLQKGLGITGPDVHTKSKLDPDAFFGLIDLVVEQHPNIKLVATTLREVHSTNRHDWAAVLWLDGQRVRQPDLRARRRRPHRRRRWVRRRVDLRPDLRSISRGIAPTRLGPRRAPDHLPR